MNLSEMKILTILTIIITDIVNASIDTNQNYNIKKNIQVFPTYGQPYIIDSREKFSFLLCLASCNSNPNCLTIMFLENVIDLNPGKCKLFSKIFENIELTGTMGSDLYEKRNVSSTVKSTFQVSSTDSPSSIKALTRSPVTTNQSTDSTTHSSTTLSTQSTVKPSQSIDSNITSTILLVKSSQTTDLSTYTTVTSTSSTLKTSQSTDSTITSTQSPITTSQLSQSITDSITYNSTLLSTVTSAQSPEETIQTTGLTLTTTQSSLSITDSTISTIQSSITFSSYNSYNLTALNARLLSGKYKIYRSCISYTELASGF
jgi:hypothetical protein